MTDPAQGVHVGKGTRCAVIHPLIRNRKRDSRSPESCLNEAVGLAAAISLDVVFSRIVSVARIKPATLMGKGAVEDLAKLVSDELHDIKLVIVDYALTPIQQRNLEKALSCKVIDRTGLILEIFGERARTSEGTLQVELAALTYARSRLVRSWTHLERQRGGLGFVGGPGETQIEADRRMIDDRILRLKKELEEVRRTRQLHRASRRRLDYAVVALVGYTNAGKSTLFNRLTKAGVIAQDQLFATLDPTMRALELPSGRSVILSDTVGFISDLPHELVAAFHATLEEVEEADIILHVRDISHEETDAQKKDVEQVLSQLGVLDGCDIPIVEVLNKIDRLSETDRDASIGSSQRSGGNIAAISAVTGQGIDALLKTIDVALSSSRETLTVKIPVEDGRTLSWLYSHGDV
ncbi:MAG: GTPase HflX, partial [Rhodospirillales bacterium]|nr:GTPase HflX [Rhodospirillales bacterium]